MPKRIALTFDDGPDAVITQQILDLLEKHRAAASFFVLGDCITPQTAPLLRRMVSLGCEICLHGQTHKDMSRMTAAEIAAEYTVTTARIRKAAGAAPKFFRPPYIAVSDTLFDTIPLPFVEGYGVRDFDDAVSAQARIDGVLQKAEDARIILLHDMADNQMTVEAAAVLIPTLKARGFTLVTMSQLFKETNTVPQRRILWSHIGQTAMYAGAND